MTCSWRWFIHPETAISQNRNGSSTLCVFKTHYRDRRAAVAKYRIFMQIQFSDHTTSATIVATVPLDGDVASSPQIGADNAGGYLVYIVTVDMPDASMTSTSSTAGTYLWAFSPSGALKYKLQLSQAGVGMMGF